MLLKRTPAQGFSFYLLNFQIITAGHLRTVTAEELLSVYFHNELGIFIVTSEIRKKKNTSITVKYKQLFSRFKSAGWF